MPVHETETRYVQYVEEVLNHHDLDRLAAYLTPDVVVHPPSVPPGLAGARLWATGTHRGEFLGVAPTGQRVSVCAFEAWRLQRRPVRRALAAVGPARPAAAAGGRGATRVG